MTETAVQCATPTESYGNFGLDINPSQPLIISCYVASGFLPPGQQPSWQVFPQLTDWEREVLDLVAEGRANTVIAAKPDAGLGQRSRVYGTSAGPLSRPAGRLFPGIS